ncbi:MAG: hypothetical protein JSU96_00190 [Acidobacteriota bacterium]|nr:MAG: hypothetical protein JSU96_00190 [Acidobacteriota bacterium]
MEIFKKNWTAAEADRWTVHDLLASLFGVVAFLLVTVGVIGAFLLQVWGFVCVAVALLLAWLMYRIIDPKLRAMSDAFEARQAEYLDDLEKTVRWEERSGT